MKKLILFIALAASTIVWAQEEDESYTGFNDLVSKLEMAASEPVPVADHSWEEVALHGGAGFNMSYANLRSPEGVTGSGIMKGLEAHFGVNLFTRRARVEGIFRNYAAESLSSNLTADLMEFEFRGVFLPPMPDKMKLRFGAGLCARYMEIEAGSRRVPHKASTPSASFMIGFERKITPTVAIGPDVSYRSALISDTFDKASADVTLRMNATF